MATYVIVPGGWAGAWYMRPLARLLQAAGQDVFTPTLTGLGERTHLARPDVGLETHVQDVVNVLLYEDLRDVILVGKSYGGMVVTAVAERVPERIRRLVYINAVIPQDGECIADLVGPDVTSSLQAGARAFDGWRVPGASSGDWRLSPMPLKAFSERVTVDHPLAARLPRAYVHGAAQPDIPSLAPAHAAAARAKRDGWSYVELPTGHEPEVEAPDDLAEVLLRYA